MATHGEPERRPPQNGRLLSGARKALPGGLRMTLRVPFLELSRQWESVGPEVMAAVTATLSAGPYILGPRRESFERAFAEYCGTRHAIGVATGTEAIRLGLQALGAGAGD